MLSHNEQVLIDSVRQIQDLGSRHEAAEARLRELIHTAEHRLQQLDQYRSAINTLIDQKTICFPWLADAISQYHELCDLKLDELLREKAHPAAKSADIVRRLAEEKRGYHHKFILARNRVIYYEKLFPWLSDFVDASLDDTLVSLADNDVDSETADDPVSRYVPTGEYKSLCPSERNQLALERFLARRKAPWEIGLDYERYVGYLYERESFAVEYHGATHGLGDLGRDLIARRGAETLIIQCKCWNEHKLIHEKHVFQLFGTTVEHWLKTGAVSSQQTSLFDTPSRKLAAQPVFVTSTRLSDIARQFAAVLNVRVREELKLDPDYPRIKCNIARGTGERIYHLPFDQLYDRVVIEPEKGEFYARTAAEAEAAGYRRAWRWKPTSNHE